MTRLLLICAGGALGTGLRYAVSVGAARFIGTEFPWGTLIVNLAGAFVIGLVQEIATESLLVPENLRLFLTVGMMGGMTTYSAFSYEAVRLMTTGAWARACLYVAVTTGVSLALCAWGMAAGRFLLAGR